jgi:hypothetical protein
MVSPDNLMQIVVSMMELHASPDFYQEASAESLALV